MKATSKAEALNLAIPPGRQGYFMPAEWAPHAATWLTWPHKEASWPGKLERIPPIFAQMARHLAAGESVYITVLNAAMEQEARRHLLAAGAELGRIRFYHFATDDSWIRDYGPIFLNRSSQAGTEASAAPAQVILDWDYTAWGGKYPPYNRDDVVPRSIGERLRVPVIHPGMVLEGGSIDVNGAGTLLTTEACLLNPNRNPHLSREQIEARLREYLGVRHILWLGEGIAGDDTDGHVDDLTRFVGPSTVITVVEPNRADVNHDPLAENLERLRGMRDESGRPLEIHTLPMPAPVECEGQRLPASYANFYIGNAVVLMPAFACAQDEAAQRRLQALFPQRRVVAIDCRDLVWGLGAFHCLTQQQPRCPGAAARERGPEGDAAERVDATRSGGILS